MIDFHAARVAAAASGAPRFAEERLDGTYWVAPDGLETGDAYVVRDGAAEWLRDGDEDYLALDMPITVVSKSSGAVMYVEHLDSGDLLEVATPVHDPDPTPLP